MKAIHLKTQIGADGTVTLPPGTPWTPGPVELIILRPSPSTAGLMQFAGTLSDEDAEEIRKAVAEECESIDADGW